MPLESATGLILRTRPLTETSLIVHWLTPDLGRLATVAKGARRPKSPFRGRLDLFYEAQFTFVRSRRSNLHILRETAVQNSHAGLRTDYANLCRAAYAAILIEQVSETDTPLPGLYSLLNDLVTLLSTPPSTPLLILAFETKLLAELGLAPSPDQTHLGSLARTALDALQQLPLALSSQIPAPPTVLAELNRFLTGFLTYHLDRIPPGRAEAVAGAH